MPYPFLFQSEILPISQIRSSPMKTYQLRNYTFLDPFVIQAPYMLVFLFLQNGLNQTCFKINLLANYEDHFYYDFAIGNGATVYSQNFQSISSTSMSIYQYLTMRFSTHSNCGDDGDVWWRVQSLLALHCYFYLRIYQMVSNLYELD